MQTAEFLRSLESIVNNCNDRMKDRFKGVFTDGEIANRTNIYYENEESLSYIYNKAWTNSLGKSDSIFVEVTFNFVSYIAYKNTIQTRYNNKVTMFLWLNSGGGYNRPGYKLNVNFNKYSFDKKNNFAFSKSLAPELTENSDYLSLTEDQMKRSESFPFTSNYLSDVFKMNKYPDKLYNHLEWQKGIYYTPPNIIQNDTLDIKPIGTQVDDLVGPTINYILEAILGNSIKYSEDIDHLATNRHNDLYELHDNEDEICIKMLYLIDSIAANFPIHAKIRYSVNHAYTISIR